MVRFMDLSIKPTLLIWFIVHLVDAVLNQTKKNSRHAIKYNLNPMFFFNTNKAYLSNSLRFFQTCFAACIQIMQKKCKLFMFCF